MAYTGKATYGILPLPKDPNRVAIQAQNGFQTQDASSSIQFSPISLATGTVAQLIIPNNVYKVYLSSPSYPFKVAETSGMSGYFLVPQNTVFEVDVANQDNVFLIANLFSTQVSFLMRF